jgi:RNA polymerase sigma-70 factor (ECF subfamily)
VQSRRPGELAAASDFELAALSARGDRTAFGVLAERAAPVAYDLLRRMGAQPALAEDLAQDAMIAALKGIGGYRGEAPFAAWTMRIAARLYFKRYAKDARTDLRAEPVDPETPSGESERRSQQRMDLDRALAQLSKGERTCVSLCHGAGMTHEEIAGLTGLALGTVKSHVNRGLAKLRRLMAAETV